MYRYHISIGTMTKDTWVEGIALHQNKFTKEAFDTMVKECVAIKGKPICDELMPNVFYIGAIRALMVYKFGFTLPEEAVCAFHIDA